MNDTYDVIVIGAGTGGYPAAIRAAQLGMRVACVERASTLGGTCLNVGCIPSKALLRTTELYAQISHGLDTHGIAVAGVSFKLEGVLARKDKVVADLTKGVAHLLAKNKVEWIKGSAEIIDATTVDTVKIGGEPQRLTAAKAIIVATGSEASTLPGIAIDEERIVSSTGALSLRAVPKHLVVIGGGYIGLELGSVWRRLGAEVTVIEYLDRIVPTMDGEIAAQLNKVLVGQGLTFRLGTKVMGGARTADGVSLRVEPASGGVSETLLADVVLVAVGRRPYTDGLGLEKLGVTRDAQGRILVDDRFGTNVRGIYAVGDVIPGPMLAHKSTEDGIACVEGIFGRVSRVDYNLVPSVIYTSPEVASVGKTEEELTASGVEFKKGTFPFSANSRARVNGDTIGLVKILADAKTDRVLGVHIIGADAGTMIPEAVLAMEFGASAEDIALTIHAHPTLPEAMREAALAVSGRAMHI